MTARTNYIEAARRHLRDADILMASKSKPNSGQLLGFSVECGLKALLIANGVATDEDGAIPRGHKLRQHLPTLSDRLIACNELIPDGPRFTHYLALVPNLDSLSDWSIDHRYYNEKSIPLETLPSWRCAAQEINAMLDQAIADGIM